MAKQITQRQADGFLNSCFNVTYFDTSTDGGVSVSAEQVKNYIADLNTKLVQLAMALADKQ